MFYIFPDFLVQKEKNFFPTYVRMVQAYVFDSYRIKSLFACTRYIVLVVESLILTYKSHLFSNSNEQKKILLSDSYRKLLHLKRRMNTKPFPTLFLYLMTYQIEHVYNRMYIRSSNLMLLKLLRFSIDQNASINESRLHGF